MPAIDRWQKHLLVKLVGLVRSRFGVSILGKWNSIEYLLPGLNLFGKKNRSSQTFAIIFRAKFAFLFLIMKSKQLLLRPPVWLRDSNYHWLWKIHDGIIVYLTDEQNSLVFFYACMLKRYQNGTRCCILSFLLGNLLPPSLWSHRQEGNDWGIVTKCVAYLKLILWDDYIRLRQIVSTFQVQLTGLRNQWSLGHVSSTPVRLHFRVQSRCSFWCSEVAAFSKTKVNMTRKQLDAPPPTDGR